MASKNYNINSNLYVNDGKIVGGYNNIATGGTYSSIVGGNGNQIKSVSSFIGGGGINYINTRYTNIVGGYGNEINSGTPSIASFSAGFNSVGSGLFNYIGFSGLSNISISTNIIGGGLGNSIYSQYSTIGHGFDNRIGRNAKPYPGLAPELLITNNNDLFNSIVSGWRNEISGSFNSIGHGLLNNISVGTINGTIAGGWYNELSTTGSEYQPYTFSRWGIGQFIGGGQNNYIGGTTSAAANPSLDQQSQYSLVVGGSSNGIYNSPFSSIVGGTLNSLRTGSDFALLGGGINNTIESGKYSLIVGGRNNYMNDSYHSSIVGGYDNTIDSPGFLSRYQFIGGGKKNSLIGTSFGYLSDYSSIVGGELNLITGSTHSFIGGGKSNRNTNRYSGSYGYSVIGGGQSNVIYEDGWSTIGGGFQNKIEGSIPGSVWVNFIGGGGGNHLYSTSYSTIAGGQANEIISIGPSIRAFNSIGGGRSNTINDANDSSIVGGQGNTIFTGVTHSSILGGQNNTVNQNNSHIIGSNITSISANTTHVERLNIGTVTTGSSSTDVFVRESNGMVNTSPISSLLSAAGVVEQLNDLSDVTIDMLPYSATTQADDGKLLFYEKDTEQWIVNDTVTHGTSVINGKKSTTGSTLTIGTPVYLVGFDNDLHTVEAANATTATTMPCIGLVAETMDNVNSKHIMTFGKLQGVDTTTGSTINPNNETWSINDDLYVSTTTGGLTKFRPTGAATQIQRIAKVLKVSDTDGQLLIFNTARTAGLPNLTENYIWVGDSNNQPVETALSSFTQQKYAASIPFTAATSQTVTHNLNDTDVIVQLKDSTGTLVIPNVVDNYTNNTVDIEVSSTETFRVIIIG